MRVRVTLGRVVALIVVVALGSMALTALFTHGDSTKSKGKSKVTSPPNKVVPGVVGQLYVFAEGALQEHGFGWKVAGPVDGWAGVTVASQDPVSGTTVVDTGAPLVTLRLVKPRDYVTQGTPENTSPFAGTKILLPAASSGTGQATTNALTTTTKTTQFTTTKTRTTTAKTSPTTTKSSTTSTRPKPSRSRPPAFTIAGAKPEPLDEIPLPQRAKNLSSWLDTHRTAGAANESYWLFQHAWIVTGAKFGWWHGAQALETLIAVDKRVERLWGIGSRSEAEARAALEFVHARSG